MANKYADREFRITERDWLNVQLDLHSLKNRGTQYAVRFEVKWGEILCHIHVSVSNMRQSRMPKEEQEKSFLSMANAERQAVSDIVCRLPALRRLIDMDKNFTVNINDDYGKGAVTVCTIRGNQIVSHWYFEEDA